MSKAIVNEFVVVANRLPVDLEPSRDGGPDAWRRSPGGLVTALEPVLRSADGAWVGWPGAPDVDIAPFVEGGLALRPVPLSSDEVAGFYSISPGGCSTFRALRGAPPAVASSTSVNGGCA